MDYPKPQRERGFDIDPSTLGAVDPEEMGFAFQLFQAGLRYTMPMESPEQTEGLALDGKTANQFLSIAPDALKEQFTTRGERLVPRDTPVNRGAFAVMNHYREHPQREAVFVRVMAFFFLMNRLDEEQWKRWCKPESGPNDGRMMVHPAVMDAVATAPLNTYGQFEPSEFSALVQRLIEDKYAE